MEESLLLKRQKGSIFPTCTVAHCFVITKGGWLSLHKVLNPYKMAISHPRFCDSEGFYHLALRLRISSSKIDHEFCFPEDIIRNQYSLQEQETRKEKWRVFSKILDFIHCFDPDYNPLDDAVTNVDKIRKLMNSFPEIIEAMNEKKQFFIKFYPDKAKKVMGRLGFTPSIGASHLTV